MALLHQEPVTISAGMTLGSRYLLKRIVGEYSEGTIWEIEDADQSSAWLFTADDMAGHRWELDEEREAAISAFKARFNVPEHPALLRPTSAEYDEASNCFYYIAPPINGGLLKDLEDEELARLSKVERIYFIRTLCEAITLAHREGWLHLGLSPRCIWLTEDKRPIVTGFMVPPHHRAHFILGPLVPAYASVEMLEGEKPMEADDVYAIGCLAFLVLGGKHPFNNEPAIRAESGKMRPYRIPDLGWLQRRALNKSVSFRRKRRWKNASAFGIALEHGWVW